MIMVVFTVALVAGTTQVSTIAQFRVINGGLRVPLAMALVVLVIVALAENARIPVDDPSTHLEVTMVHEAMALEYSGRHLAMIELAASLRFLLYVSLIDCIFVPFGLSVQSAGALAQAVSVATYVLKVVIASLLLATLGDIDHQNARIPDSQPTRNRADARAVGYASSVRVRGHVMSQFSFDVAHMFAGGLVLVSFMMLYQDRLLPLINALSLHSLLLALSVAWQANIQAVPDLYVTAFFVLDFKTVVVPVALRRMVRAISPTRVRGAGARRRRRQRPALDRAAAARCCLARRVSANCASRRCPWSTER